jgi:hypothetical protein
MKEKSGRKRQSQTEKRGKHDLPKEIELQTKTDADKKRTQTDRIRQRMTEDTTG